MYSPEAQQTFLDSTHRPTVDQMLELQKISVVLAKVQKKFRKGSYDDNSHVFIPKGIQNIEIVDGDEGFRYSRQSYLGKVARVGFQSWRMRITERFEVNDYLAGDDGLRHSYEFEWDKRGVHVAKKVFHACELPRDESDTAENVIMILAEPDYISFTQNIENVSRGDCDLLVRDMQKFSEASNASIIS